jgi:integrase
MPRFKTVADALERGPGRYALGRSIYLTVRGGSALFEYQFRLPGHKFLRTVSLGSAIGPNKITKTDAQALREEHWIARRSLAPPRERKRKPSTRRSFGEVVTDFLAEAAPDWRGSLDGPQALDYKTTLLKSDLAKHPVSTLDTKAIGEMLSKWRERPERAEKLRNRIERLLDFATAKGERSGPNPASREIVSDALPWLKEALRQNKDERRGHPMMEPDNVRSLMQDLRDIGSVSAKALAFTILTAARADEVIGSKHKSPATWGEIHRKGEMMPAPGMAGKNGKQGELVELPCDMWIIPGERMKERREHRVPLTPQALALLGEQGKPDARLFPNRAANGSLNQGAMLEVLDSLYTGVTVHGFRATFSTWAALNRWEKEIRDIALAHAVGNDVSRRYQRSDLIVRRLEMMTQWADFATTGKITSTA